MRLLGAILLALVLAVPVDAGNEPLVFTRDSVDHQYPVEQQSPDFFYGPGTHPETWVTNPTDCDWDLDDHESWVGSGNIPANTTVSSYSCQVSDGLVSYGHWETFQASVTASTNDLTVTVTNDFGGSWTLAPTGSGHSYRYVRCEFFQRPGPYPTVADSNGGYGFVVTYSLNITAGSHAAHGVSAVYQHGPGIYSIC